MNSTRSPSLGRGLVGRPSVPDRAAAPKSRERMIASREAAPATESRLLGFVMWRSPGFEGWLGSAPAVPLVGLGGGLLEEGSELRRHLGVGAVGEADPRRQAHRRPAAEHAEDRQRHGERAGGGGVNAVL